MILPPELDDARRGLLSSRLSDASAGFRQRDQR